MSTIKENKISVQKFEELKNINFLIEFCTNVLHKKQFHSKHGWALNCECSIMDSDMVSQFVEK